MFLKRTVKAILFFSVFTPGYLFAGVTTAPHVTASRIQKFAHGTVELVSANKSLSSPGNSEVGVLFRLDPGWHVYAKEPGDLGLPTVVSWRLPAGISNDELRWPTPEKFTQDELVSYGYEGQVLLSTALHLPQDSSLHEPIVAEVSWVLCKNECVPGEARLSLNLSDAQEMLAAYQPSLFAQFHQAETTGGSPVVSGWAAISSSMALALLGGIILNLMPCVFPIISIKVLGFAKHSGERQAKLHALVFGAGVLVSFWVLAGTLLALRYQGQSVGWGFQFQSPIFVAIMAMFLFALALSLAGLFEVGAGVQSWAGRFGAADGYVESFMSGALATLLSTPCSAPFMGSAIAAAMVLSSFEAFLIFTCLAVGMAAPYVLLSFFPALRRLMPRPGTWMVSFKQAMSFPIFATVVWLMWVLGLQIGLPGLAAFTFSLVLMAMGFWIYGRWCTPMASPFSRRLAFGLCGSLLLGAAYLGIPLSRATAGEIQASRAYDEQIDWQPFTKSALETKLSERHAVLVNFTAAWCLSCQVNHRLVYSSKELADKLKEKGVVTLRADWTNKNPEITKAIDHFEKNGVPLDVLFIPDQKPVVFPSILTQGALNEALERLL